MMLPMTLMPMLPWPRQKPVPLPLFKLNSPLNYPIPVEEVVVEVEVEGDAVDVVAEVDEDEVFHFVTRSLLW